MLIYLTMVSGALKLEKNVNTVHRTIFSNYDKRSLYLAKNGHFMYKAATM